MLINNFIHSNIQNKLNMISHPETYISIRQGMEVQRQEVKNEYSTFIEELEETTEQLMNEVFNVEYQPQIHEQRPFTQPNKKRKVNNKFPISPADKNEKNSLGFDQFMRRNKKWQEIKEKNLEVEREKRKNLNRKEYREVPEILRGSRQRLDPLFERALDIHHSKEQNKTFKKIDQKKKQEEEFQKKHSFHPETLSKKKSRTFQQYLQHKQDWQRKKEESIRDLKMQQEAKKYTQCQFSPVLISKQYPIRTRRDKTQRVQERLLRSLEKSFEQLIG